MAETAAPEDRASFCNAPPRNRVQGRNCVPAHGFVIGGAANCRMPANGRAKAAGGRRRPQRAAALSGAARLASGAAAAPVRTIALPCCGHVGGVQERARQRNRRRGRAGRLGRGKAPMVSTRTDAPVPVPRGPGTDHPGTVHSMWRTRTMRLTDPGLLKQQCLVGAVTSRATGGAAVRMPRAGRSGTGLAAAVATAGRRAGGQSRALAAGASTNMSGPNTRSCPAATPEDHTR